MPIGLFWPPQSPKNARQVQKKAVEPGGTDADRDHKIALAANIQLLQELKGLTIADTKELLQLDRAALELFVKMLKP